MMHLDRSVLAVSEAVRRLGVEGLVLVFAVVSGLAFVQPSQAEMVGWQAGWPTSQRMLQGRDPAQVERFLQWNAALEKNPNDSVALDNRAVVSMEFGRQGLYRTYWHWLAAKDLERAVQVNPKDFYAWHNYGDLNYSSGDFWVTGDHSNAQRAVSAFTRALELNPQSARSYMGRGWAYLAMDDTVRASADLRAAAQLDPSLRASIDSEIGNIRVRKRQEAAARGTINQMGRYIVSSARTREECDKMIGYWTQGECRISQALNPGPVQPNEGQLRGQSSSAR